MDSLTQALLGATVGEAVLGKKAGNRAVVWGAIGGTIPDLDVLSRFFVDGLTANELHRGFSHSIVFCIIGAVVFGWLISLIHKNHGNAKGWMMLMFGALFTHTWLDAHTTWGTQVFWPLDYKISFNNIFIIDPLYTIPMLVFLILALRYKRGNVLRTKYNHIGLVISSAYMFLTIVFKGIAFIQIKKHIEALRIPYTDIATRPTPFNSILWNVTVKTGNEYYVGYYSLFDEYNNFPLIRFEKNEDLLGEMKNEDVVKRLIKLSEENYIIQKKGDKIVFNDLRFGQQGMASPDKEFVFSYELFYDEHNQLQANEIPKTFKGSGAMLKELGVRLLGN